MKLTHNALNMLLKAYRAVLKKSLIKNTVTATVCTLSLAMGSAYADNTWDKVDPANADFKIDVDESDSQSISINNGNSSEYADSIIYLNGSANLFLQNDAEKGQIGSVIFNPKNLNDIVNPSDPTNASLLNYIKNFGGDLSIDEIHLNNDTLNSKTSIKNVLKFLESNYDKFITGDVSVIFDPNLKESVKDILYNSAFNIGNLEFWGNNGNNNQSFNIENAYLGRYSILRLQEAGGATEALDSSVTINNLDMDNLSAVAIGVIGQAKAPDNIQIDHITVNGGGATMGWTGLISRDNNTVNVGTININGNTLDLSASPISIGLNDIIDANMITNEGIKELLQGNDLESDLALHRGEFVSKINAATGDAINKILNMFDPSLNSSSIDRDSIGTIQGVTLAGIDGNAVTVNLLPDNEKSYTYGPELVLGDVAKDTAVNVNLGSAVLDAQYQTGENAVLLKGEFGENASLNLHYTDGVNSESEVSAKLNEIASKITIGQIAYVPETAQVDLPPYATDYTDNDANYKDKQFTANIDAFGLMDGYTADLEQVGKSGDPDQDYKVNPDSIRIGELNINIDSLLDPAVLSAMMWRTQMDNLVYRLGDLHEANAANGLWVRAYGGNQDFDDRNIDNNYYGIQIGYDHNMGYGWTLGSALSYTQGDADFDKGSSDAYAFDLAVYGTWLHESGFYTDLVAKFGVVNTDNSLNFHNPNISASDSANSTAFGLSAEVGFKYDVNDLFYIEPQAQLSYSHIGDADASYGPFTADYKDINMLIGRVGFRAGVNLPEDYGSVYLRANGLKDFNGDVDADLYFDNGAVPQSRSVSEEMDDAWYEVGLGTTLKFNDSFYVYAECMYADGGDVDAIYGNLGARLMF